MKQKTLIASLVLLLVLACQRTGVQHSGPEALLSDLPLQSLLEHVPRAGAEWRYDRTTETGEEHPASVELRRRLLSGTRLSDDQWRYLLLNTGAIAVREKWPADTLFAVSMTVPLWLGLAQIRAYPDLPGLRSAEAGELFSSWCGFATSIARLQAKYQELGMLPPHATGIVFDVTIERGESWRFDAEGPPPGDLWRGKIKFPVSSVATLDQAVPPVSGPELDEVIRRSIGAGIRKWWIDERYVQTLYVVIDPDTNTFPTLAHTGLPLKVEVLRDGEVIEDGPLVASRFDDLALGNSVTSAALRFVASRNLRSIPPDVAIDSNALQRWHLRVSDVSDDVLVLWDAKVRWAGTIIVPLAEAIAHETDRTGPSGRGLWLSTPVLR